MSSTQTFAAAKHDQVTVVLMLSDEQGNSQEQSFTLDSGPIKVSGLKALLGVPAESSLWVIQKNGKRKQLADHQNHNVKEGDRFEALVKGGIS